MTCDCPERVPAVGDDWLHWLQSGPQRRACLTPPEPQGHPIQASQRWPDYVTGHRPARQRQKEEVSAEARWAIGGDIKTVQLGWPMGMPLVR